MCIELRAGNSPPQKKLPATSNCLKILHVEGEVVMLREGSCWGSTSMRRLTYLLTYLFTHLLTPWSTVLLEKLTYLQLVKKFPAFYGTRKFITVFTSARQLSLSWASSIQSIPPHPTSWRSILILSSHRRLGLPSGHFHLRFPHKNPIRSPLLSPYTLHAPPPSHSFRFYHPNNSGWAVLYKLL